METSQTSSSSQDDSNEVSPYPKENLERNRNRRANSPGSSQVSESLTINHEASSDAEGSDISSDRQKPKSNPKGSKDLPAKPGKRSKAKRVVNTRAGVTQLPDGRFMARVDLPPFPDGRRRRKSFTAKTQKGALDKKQEYLTSLDRNLEPDGRETKLRDFVKDWLENVGPLTCKPNTLNNYAIALRKHILPHLGDKRLKELRGHHIDEIMFYMQKKGLSLNTRKGARRVIRSVLTYAVRRDYLDRNPVSNSMPPKKAPGEKQKGKETLNKDQFATLLAYLETHPYKMLFRTYLFTGMRRGEALGLTWDDIVYDGQEYLVRVNKQRLEQTHRAKDGVGSTGLATTAPKTSNGNRQITIPEFIYRELMEYRLNKSDNFPNDLVFSSHLGGQLWPSRVTRMWSEIRKTLGFDEVRLHDIRHTYALTALIGGAPLEALSDVMGHHSITITKDIYAGRIPTSGKRVAEALVSVIGPAQEINALEQQLARSPD
jgi:integrase